MGKLILEYILFILCSFVLAALAVCYRRYYLKKEKPPLKEIFAKLKSNSKSNLKSKLTEIFTQSKIFLIACIIFYNAAAVIGLVFCQSRGISVLSLAQALVILDTLFLISVIDFKVKKIPNLLLLLLLIFRVLNIFVEILIQPSLWLTVVLSSLLGMFVGGFIILICMLISRGGVGAGDMKLYAIVGFYYGLSGALGVMMYSLFLAAISSIVLLISRKAKMKSSLPMAPFVFVGLIIYFLFL